MEERRILEELKIVPLLTKFVRGEDMTVLEEKTIEIWLNESSANRAFFEELQDKDHVARELLKRDAASATTSSELLKLHGVVKKRQSHYKRVIIWTTAAAILLFFSLTILLYRYHQSRNVIDETVNMATADIDPGKDQATLTFDDGQVIDLEGKTVKSDADGVTYLNGQAVSPSKMQFATLTTPRKGQYKAILPDGTTVWLNAESKLKYPTKFAGAERLVELEGEGYFEVAHNASRPFIVESKGQRVKVLGTKFNINSYTNEEYTRTTLISGSVELRNLQNELMVRLKPGEQGRFVLGGIDVKKVDPETFIGWTDNEFQFNGAQLVEVLRQLERWYDIDVDYQNVPNAKVYATISRDKKLTSVLFALGEVTDLNFKMTGRRIEIKK
ncbi:MULTISPECIES: FecR family protein [Chryseobacterium]|uniref:Fec operon regulator FecR n=2 Tax=Chryseobacterium gleum TaxID=250 RepID=A0A448B9I2_CHRGE|nr:MULTISPECIES: FecR family protein [Chryseobacterium]QQY31776.1 FecR domain-containing protein [Chryseobacterium gleum]VEE11181.1 fec operon regulator FecR [Chryseobacterium gleum]VFA44000.1 fec operon regulator FecR [Chryseobacterium indologenes]